MRMTAQIKWTEKLTAWTAAGSFGLAILGAVLAVGMKAGKVVENQDQMQQQITIIRKDQLRMMNALSIEPTHADPPASSERMVDPLFSKKKTLSLPQHSELPSNYDFTRK